MGSGSFLRDFTITLAAALGLFSLEVAWSLLTAPTFPFPLLLFPAAVLLIVVLSLGIPALFRPVQARDPRHNVELGALLTLLILGIKLMLIGGGKNPEVFAYLLGPVAFAAYPRIAYPSKSAPGIVEEAANFWPLLVVVSLLVSTDLLTVFMIYTSGLSTFQIILGTGAGCMLFLTLEGTLRFFSEIEGFLLGRPKLLGGLLAAVLVGVGIFWGINRTPAASPYGVRTPLPPFTEFTGTVPPVEPGGERTIEDLPNIVLISVDTLRWDFTPPMDTGLTVPNLRRLHRDSVNYTHTFTSEEWTLPSHASLFSGRLPWQHGAVQLGQPMDPSVTLFPQLLRKLGYSTAAFTDGGFLERTYGFPRGFDTYRVDPFDRFPSYERYAPGGLEILYGLGLWPGQVPLEIYVVKSSPAEGGRHRFENTVEQARNWIRHHESHRSRPFFLFLHTYEVHDYNVQLYEEPLRKLQSRHPRLAKVFPSEEGRSSNDGVTQGNWKQSNNTLKKPPVRYLRRELLQGDSARLRSFTGLPSKNDFHLDRLRKWRNRQARILSGLRHLYRYGIESFDGSLGDLLDFLRDRELYEPTLIVFFSDHGEGFVRGSRVLGHHSGQHEDTLIRIPFWVKWPGNRRAGQRRSTLLQVEDIFPLLFRRLKIEAPLPQIRASRPGSSDSGEPKSLARKYVVGSSRTQSGTSPRFLVRDHPYKLVSNMAGSRRRFSRVRDMSLRETLVAPDEVPDTRRQQLKNRLNALIRDYRDFDAPYQKGEPQDMSWRFKRQLKALGYLD